MPSFKSSSIFFTILLTILSLVVPVCSIAQQLDPKYYDMGSPTLKTLWVDPVNGNDNNDGSSRTKAFLTISAAWSSLPGTATTTGYRISLVAGNYVYRDQATNAIVGRYLDERHGTFNYPIILESADGPQKARLYSSLDFRDVRYVYLVGLDFVTDPSSDGGGNTVHFADGDHIFLKNCRINGSDGTTRKAQESLKVNQVRYIYVEDCDISGAFWFSLDYVGVEYGHIQGCAIHDASVDCLLLKGGTAQIRVEDNLVYNAERFGVSAGQGAGFDFMVPPWLHYEAYDLKFINNIIHHTAYAGIAVLGGYNILMAYNTLYKVGIDTSDARSFLSFGLGQRGCDGAENDTCNVHHQQGGWSPGPWSTPPLDYGNEADCIPSKNVYFYNNIVYNPGKDSTLGGHFEIRGPYDASDQSPTFLQSCNLPNPVLSDENLQIKGNLIWNGSPSKPLGLDENSGGQDSNPTCNSAQLVRDNIINSLEPKFADTTRLDFHPARNSPIFTATTMVIPSFSGTDRPSRPLVPLGNLANSIQRDYDGKSRSSTGPPGAFSSSLATSVQAGQGASVAHRFELGQNYPNPFNPITTITYELPARSVVTLKVFDMLGREIAALVDQELEAGAHRAVFDASRLSSGVYFYRLQGTGSVQTRKLVLMK
jgi:hypothetical protein